MSEFSDKKTVFIIGANSFIGRHIYINLKRANKHKVLLCSHDDISVLENATNDDIVINLCGINRSTLYEDYEEANVSFVKKVVQTLQSYPFFIHVSSLMVCGFQNKELSDLPEQTRWFITTKLDGENFLRKNYSSSKLAIVRPSNIFGYDCPPYYNNILASIIYEKIYNYAKINKLNDNSYRNMLSINGLITKILSISHEKISGTFNIVSSNTVSMKELGELVYDSKLPEHIYVVSNRDYDYPTVLNGVDNEQIVVIDENLSDKIKEVERQMSIFYRIKDNVEIKKLYTLKQPRGEMVEISDLQSSRLYKITITEGSVRGNHYHSKQIEEFYTNSGRVVYAFAHQDDPDVLFIYYSQTNDKVKIYPNIIHTLSNDYTNNTSELFVGSTQCFVPNSTPDTTYITLF